MLGGVAFLKGLLAFSSPIAFVQSIFRPVRDIDGVRVNAHGLTEEGKRWVGALIHRKVWIDLSHTSDASLENILPMLQQAGQPPLYTHTVLRKYYKAERGLSDSQLRIVGNGRGFLGLMPSEQMLMGTPSAQGPCRGSVHALATQFQEMAREVGENAVTLGSDFNGGISHLKPSCQTGTLLDHSGFWNIGQTPEVWEALRRLGVWHPQGLETPGRQTTQKFLLTWSHLWLPKTALASN